MLILLPPSEGKIAPSRGKPVDLGSLTTPELTPARDQVLGALITLCRGGDETAARGVLGLGAGQAGEVRRNTLLRDAPTARAEQIYSGVLYEALDVATLSSPAKRLMRRSLLVFSGLWGVVGLADRIPAYRCPVGVSLPGIGGLGAFWRKHLPTAMAALARNRLVVDMRSGPYAAMWHPTTQHAVIRVLHERMVGGMAKRTVVSHFNKATKGRVLRDLAMAGHQPRTIAELVDALRQLKYTAEREGSQVDIVVNEM